MPQIIPSYLQQTLPNGVTISNLTNTNYATTNGVNSTQAIIGLAIPGPSGAIPGGTPSNPFCVKQSNTGTLNDLSGTISASGVSQQISPANLNRKYLFLQNLSMTDLYFNFNANASLTQGSMKLVSNGTFTMENNFICTQSLNVVGTTIGQSFTAKEG